MTVPEAVLRETDAGLVPEGDGWFVVNVAEAQGTRHEQAGTWVRFESPDARFPHFGINIHVVQPGQANAKYHSEAAQEGFLVLSGECLLIVEEQERRLKAWDFFHCPPGTHHVIVGAGDGPCAIVMVGARLEDEGLDYPASALAARYGASARESTPDPEEAYAGWSDEFAPAPFPWPPA